ncbi:MAG TPA: alpha/beta hydrolase [Sphingomicrobium sp.]
MRFKRIALRLLLGAVFLYAAVVLVMYSLQTDMLFPRDAVGPAGPSPPGTEQLQLRTADGEVLRGVHIPPADTAAGERLLVLGFAGNAWNSENAAALLHDLYPKADVVAFHYRGYAPSTGSPSARALMDDAPLIHDFAVARLRPSRTVAVGFSIGSAVAADLAGRRPLDGAILVTPFDSLRSVAEAWYPRLPVRALFKHEIDAAGAIERSQAPVAVISAERDEVVPTVRTDALKGRIPNLVFDRAIPGAGHNDLYGRAEFEQAMGDAMSALGK